MTPQDVLQRLEALPQGTPNGAEAWYFYGPRLVAVARAAQEQVEYLKRLKHRAWTRRDTSAEGIAQEAIEQIEAALAALGEEAGHG